jgi:hypothetical protein
MIKTAIESVLDSHDKHFNKINFSAWMSKNRKVLMDQEVEISEMYAEFCVMADREGRPLIKFNDFIELINKNKT